MISVRMWSRPPTTVPQLGGSYGTVAFEGVSGFVIRTPIKGRQNRSVQLSLGTIAGQACCHKAFIVSNNIKRRHLNSGQRAMAVAMMYPTPTLGKSLPEIGNTQGESKKTFQNNPSMARTVLRADPIVAEEFAVVIVVLGMLPVVLIAALLFWR
jgi:hypothetical protein